MKVDDTLYLQKIIDMEAKDNIRILELGVEKGVSTLQFCEMAKKNNGHVWAIDHWQDQDTMYHNFIQKVYELEYDSTLTIYRADLFLIFDIFKKGFFDIIYFDAVCTWPAIKLCLLWYLPYLKVGGVACGHGGNCYWSKLDEVLRIEYSKERYFDYIEVPIRYLDEYDNEQTGKIHTNLVRALYDITNDMHQLLYPSHVWVARTK